MIYTQCLNFFSNPAIVRFLWKKTVKGTWTLLPGVAAPGAQQMCCNLPPRGPCPPVADTSIASNVQQVQILKILQQIAWCFIAYTVAYTMTCHDIMK